MSSPQRGLYGSDIGANMLRAGTAEVFGTFLLVFTGTAVAVSGALSRAIAGQRVRQLLLEIGVAPDQAAGGEVGDAGGRRTGLRPPPPGHHRERPAPSSAEVTCQDFTALTIATTTVPVPIDLYATSGTPTPNTWCARSPSRSGPLHGVPLRSVSPGAK